MYYADIKKADVANGLGVRVSVFVSGCTHHCKNCFNEEAWDFHYGNEFTQNEIDKLKESIAAHKEAQKTYEQDAQSLDDYVNKLKEEYIKLGQALKAAGLVESGVDAKFAVQDGLVKVNGQVETQRGKKLVEGDIVEYDGNSIKITG